MKKLFAQALLLASLTLASFGQTKQGLPPGLTLSSSGVVAGTPTAAGQYQFQVQACDSETPPVCSPVTAINLLVVGNVVVAPTTLPNAVTNQKYQQQLGASGGVPPYTFTQQGQITPTTVAPAPATK